MISKDGDLPTLRADDKNKGMKSKSVSFSTVTVRHYDLTLGTVNPYATMSSSSSPRSVGVPLTLSWKYDQLPSQPLSDCELPSRRRRRKPTRMSPSRRRAILESNGDVSGAEIEEAERAARRCEERRRRYLAQCTGSGDDDERRRVLEQTAQFDDDSAKSARGGQRITAPRHRGTCRASAAGAA